MAEASTTTAAAGFTNELFPIRTATQSCRQLLEQYATQFAFQKDHWAQSRFSEFNLWAAGIGASTNELNCLDKRLERDPSAQQVVIGALVTLEAWTTKCIELAKAADSLSIKSLDKQPQDKQPQDKQPQSDSESDNGEITLDEAKKTIEKLLKVLVDLEIAIRRVGTASRMRRADCTFDRRRHLYEEIEGNLRFLLQSPSLTNPPDSPNQINVQSAIKGLQGECIPLREEQEILLLANIKRVHRFMFYKARQEHLHKQTQTPSHPTGFKIKSSPPKPSNLPMIDNENQPIKSSLPATNESFTKPALSRHSAGTTNQASDYMPSSLVEQTGERKSPGYAATVIALRAVYPKPPKDKTKCPYCLIPFRGEIDDEVQWKAHISEDLQPYTCYLPNCPYGNPFFNKFGAWETHVLAKYHKQFEGWACRFCSFISKPNEESLFLIHIEKDHSNAIATKSIANFAKVCRQFTVPALERCPVCSTIENDWKLRKKRDTAFEPEVNSFLEHIGQCIHFFALKVLPDDEPTEPYRSEPVRYGLLSTNMISVRNLRNANIQEYTDVLNKIREQISEQKQAVDNKKKELRQKQKDNESNLKSSKKDKVEQEITKLKDQLKSLEKNLEVQHINQKLQRKGLELCKARDALAIEEAKKLKDAKAINDAQRRVDLLSKELKVLQDALSQTIPSHGMTVASGTDSRSKRKRS